MKVVVENHLFFLIFNCKMSKMVAFTKKVKHKSKICQIEILKDFSV